jgi:hypothetical protein
MQRRIFPNKKAQFYIFTALILMAYTATLLKPTTLVTKPSKVFSETNDNFRIESKEVINNALLEQKNISKEYDSFTRQFIDYSKMRGIKLEVFLVLVSGEQVYLTNHMKNSVSLLGRSEIIGPEGSLILQKNMTSIAISALNDESSPNIYDFNITTENIQASSLLRFQEGQNSKVFMNG